MLWNSVSTSSHSEVDVLVVSSVRNIEDGNSQLEHEKVCFISFCLFMNSRMKYKTLFPAFPSPIHLSSEGYSSLKELTSAKELFLRRLPYQQNALAW